MTAYKFCQIEDVKKYVKMGAGYTGHDTLIDNVLIPNATILVQQYCRREFIYQQYMEYLPTYKQYAPVEFWLKESNLDIAIPPSLRLYYGYPDSWNDIAAVDSRYYAIDYAKGRITLFLDTADHRRSLQVIYYAGYEVAADGVTVLVPEGVKQATAMQTAFSLQRTVSGEIGTKDSKSPAGAVNPRLVDTSETGLIPSARSLLNPYRKQLVGRFG